MQFDLAPSSMTIEQLTLFARLARLPHNCVSRRGYAEWKSWGGPQLPDVGITNQAALLRTARITLPGWRSLCSMLDRAAEDGTAMGDWKRRARAPAFWTSPTICCMLEWAHCGFQADQVPFRCALSRRQALQVQSVGRAMLRSSPAPGRQPSQAQWYRAGIAGLLSAPLAETLAKRLARWRVDHAGLDFEATRLAVQATPPGWRLQFFRTVVNGWITSSRLGAGAPPRRCLFGCSEDDRLDHYLRCQPLRRIAAEVVGRPAPDDLRVLLGFLDAGDLQQRDPWRSSEACRSSDPDGYPGQPRFDFFVFMSYFFHQAKVAAGDSWTLNPKQWDDAVRAAMSLMKWGRQF